MAPPNLLAGAIRLWREVVAGAKRHVEPPDPPREITSLLTNHMIELPLAQAATRGTTGLHVHLHLLCGRLPVVCPSTDWPRVPMPVWPPLYLV